METPPWTQNQLKRLGASIRDEVPPAVSLPAYSDVLLWYNRLAGEVQQVIARHNWTPILGRRAVETTSRAKTLDTLRQKLQRDRSTPLASIQDLAGVRFETEMSLDEQDAVAHGICRLFGHKPESGIHDLRQEPHSGYRAVHVWLRTPAGRVEVQVRTHLQSEWANAYESMADVLGRDIRYDLLPAAEAHADMVRGMREISTIRIAAMERAANDVAQIKSEYAQQLRSMHEYDRDDTLPHGLVVAQEAAARIDELEAQIRNNELVVRRRLMTIKRMFDDMSKGGS